MADLRITLCASLQAGAVQELALCLPPGSCVADALAASAWALPADMACGIWGKVVARNAPLHDGDRIECYRVLTVDPKVARRQRFARQGARTSGLFARQRPGGKAGY
ncbi:RnfH family protein [Acidovorax sp. HDW3]|uniref:RnfH family protein n=1 Tax=Acidovorax sp. HDW3 TaxID=2714923 RepID=UPI0014082694|nr:RnfH family protein [Acidovorax sp. HDW3]QIL44229.1 RnfH family protein [Acidovorax sp. HDW3]